MFTAANLRTYWSTWALVMFSILDVRDAFFLLNRFSLDVFVHEDRAPKRLLALLSPAPPGNRLYPRGESVPWNSIISCSTRSTSSLLPSHKHFSSNASQPHFCMEFLKRMQLLFANLWPCILCDSDFIVWPTYPLPVFVFLRRYTLAVLVSTVCIELFEGSDADIHTPHTICTSLTCSLFSVCVCLCVQKAEEIRRPKRLDGGFGRLEVGGAALDDHDVVHVRLRRPGWREDVSR